MPSFSKALPLLSLLAGAGASPLHFKRDDYVAVFDADFPDPAVMQASDGTFYAYSTAGNDVNAQVASSTDGMTWTRLEGTDALGDPPAWSPDSIALWAPDVAPGPDNNYIMYFSATSAEDDGKHCIGVATSDSPEGPFNPVSEEPWVCDLDDGGNIDPAQFTDTNGDKWVVYKVDGNSIGSDSTAIMLQQVDADGITKVGDATEILNRDEADGPLVEAPSLAVVDGTYYLTFSSNMYNTDLYDSSFATASSVTGPYTKAQDPDAPLLVTGDRGLTAPGGADMLVTANSSYFAFHADCDSGRCFFMTTFSAADGKITLA